MQIDAPFVENLFAHSDGYRFARWGRPIAPVVFGVDDATLNVMKDAIAQTVAVTGGALAETDPELRSGSCVNHRRDVLRPGPVGAKRIPNHQSIGANRGVGPSDCSARIRIGFARGV